MPCHRTIHGKNDGPLARANLSIFRHAEWDRDGRGGGVGEADVWRVIEQRDEWLCDRIIPLLMAWHNVTHIVCYAPQRHTQHTANTHMFMHKVNLYRIKWFGWLDRYYKYMSPPSSGPCPVYSLPSIRFSPGFSNRPNAIRAEYAYTTCSCNTQSRYRKLRHFYVKLYNIACPFLSFHITLSLSWAGLSVCVLGVFCVQWVECGAVLYGDKMPSKQSPADTHTALTYYDKRRQFPFFPCQAAACVAVVVGERAKKKFNVNQMINKPNNK